MDNDILKNIYSCYTICLNNKIFIENENDTKILILDDQLLIGTNIIKLDGLVNKKSFYFSNCKNLLITINTKINHLTINRCKNLTIVLTSGTISGIDNISSEEVNVFIENIPIYFVDISNSKKCNFTIQEKLLHPLIVSSIYNTDISVLFPDKANNNISNKIFQLLEPLFDNYYLYVFLHMDDKIYTSYQKNISPYPVTTCEIT